MLCSCPIHGVVGGVDDEMKDSSLLALREEGFFDRPSAEVFDKAESNPTSFVPFSCPACRRFVRRGDLTALRDVYETEGR